MQQTPEFEKLFIRCQQGELEAFSDLFTEYKGSVYRLAATILRDEQDAEDATQDVFLRVFRQAGAFRGQSSFTTWLTAIVVNVCRDRLRRQKLRRAIMLERLRHLASSDSQDVEEEVVHRQQRRSLWLVVDGMDEKIRLPVILFYQEGLSVQEIAQVLRFPARTIYTRLHMARERLRASMQVRVPVPGDKAEG